MLHEVTHPLHCRNQRHLGVERQPLVYDERVVAIGLVKCLQRLVALRPVESGERDVIGFSTVTMGPRVAQRAAELFASDRYTDYLYLHGLGVEMAEAMAEYFHKRIRTELGIAGADADTPEALFRQGYQGSRYSFGYAACPNLEDRQQLFELLDPRRIGLELSEEFQLHPEQSTDALIVHHPEAKYFNAR
ncbi:MAG: hypothetical protein KY442_11865 [Proteobacteria bacterium]|nr:hypothetical protein [Pseudomonadota bacterium]